MNKSNPLVINQQYEPVAKVKPTVPSELGQKIQEQTQEVEDFNNAGQALKSYATVLEQSLITKDKQIIKEILSNTDQEIIKNSIWGIPAAKVAILLEQIEILLLEEVKDPKQTLAHLDWLSRILKVHLGTIINSPEIQTVAARIARIAKKRRSFIGALE